MISLSKKYGIDVEYALSKHVDGLMPILCQRVKNHKKEHEQLEELLPKDKLEQILSGQPKDLLNLQNEINKIPSELGIESLIPRIFNYKSFQKYSPIKYNAFSLANNLNVQSCPYCNAQYTKTISKGKNSFRPTFDHFFPQKNYPILALSFYNLIPSCSTCNSKKKENGYDLNHYFHPYIHEIEPDLRVTWFPKKSLTANFLAEDFDLKIVPTKSTNKERIDNHLFLFQLNTLYEKYKDEAAEILTKQLSYPESYKTTIRELLCKAGNFSHAELNRLIYGNYVESKDLLKRPLSKLTKDFLMNKWYAIHYESV